MHQYGMGLAFGISRVLTLPHFPQWRSPSGHTHSSNHSVAASSVGNMSLIWTRVMPSRWDISGALCIAKPRWLAPCIWGASQALSSNLNFSRTKHDQK